MAHGTQYDLLLKLKNNSFCSISASDPKYMRTFILKSDGNLIVGFLALEVRRSLGWNEFALLVIIFDYIHMQRPLLYKYLCRIRGVSRYTLELPYTPSTITSLYGTTQSNNGPAVDQPPK